MLTSSHVFFLLQERNQTYCCPAGQYDINLNHKRKARAGEVSVSIASVCFSVGEKFKNNSWKKRKLPSKFYVWKLKQVVYITLFVTTTRVKKFYEICSELHQNTKHFEFFFIKNIAILID